MNLEEITRFLDGSALFAEVDSEQIRTVAASAIVESHPAGTIIIKEDTPSDYFYIITEGKVDVYREQKHLVLESLSAGAVFGLLSIIENKPRSATVETTAPTTLVKLDLHYIGDSLPHGKDIYHAIALNHINDLAAIIRSNECACD